MKEFGKNDPEFTAMALGERSEELDAGKIAEADLKEFEELKEFSAMLGDELKGATAEEAIGDERMESIRDSMTQTETRKVLRFPVWFSAAAACLTMGMITTLVVWTNRNDMDVIVDPPLTITTPSSTPDSMEKPLEDRDTAGATLALSEKKENSAPPEIRTLEGLISAPELEEPAGRKDLRLTFDENRMEASKIRLQQTRQLEVTSSASMLNRMEGDGAVYKTAEIAPAPPNVSFAPAADLLVPSEPANREGYNLIEEKAFVSPLDSPLSTFSIDVDTASYANVRRFIDGGQLPPVDAVRIEELINYFKYDYAQPEDETPFSVTVDSATAPWKEANRLVRIGLQGKVVSQEARPAANLVFLIDVSGSMSSANKLPLAQQAMSLLVDQMRDDDRIAVVVYAGSSGLALPSTTANNKETIKHAIVNLRAGGSTNGASGIELAYETAQKHFVEDGINRVILCTDGDFNVGISDQGALTRLIEEKAKTGVFFSAIGFGQGNYRDDMMETLSNRGNGNYAYIDGEAEARKVFVEDMLGTLLTIAKDVKIQVEFNPSKVASYRLIGYENRALAARDFNDDTKDAGEIGSGHSVTALYEIVPVGGESVGPMVDPLRYQSAKVEDSSDELLTVKLRYKLPDEDTSSLIERPFVDAGKELAEASDDFRFAAAVAGFGLVLRDSEYVGSYTLGDVETLANGARGVDAGGLRTGFVSQVRKAAAIDTK